MAGGELKQEGKNTVIGNRLESSNENILIQSITEFETSSGMEIQKQ